MIDEKIFKEYDIRGIYPKEIDEKNLYLISRAFVFFLKRESKNDKELKIVIGRDKRKSSQKLIKAAIEGLLSLRVKIINIDTVSTPEFNFAVSFLKADGGMMITASHNPLNYNGVKLVRRNSIPVGGDDLQKIYKIAIKIKEAKTDKRRKNILIQNFDIKKEYIKAILKDEKAPLPKIKARYDYDQDRVFVKDEDGKEIRPDILGGILAMAIGKKKDIVIYDLRCSKAIPENLKNKGIVAIPSRVGHYNIKKKMRERGAIFGLEITGHYYFKKFNYCEAPLYALKILEDYKKETGKNLSELAIPFNKYFHSGIINLRITDNGSRITKIVEKLIEKYRNGAQNNLDGLTVEFSNWWFNVRKSNTEPLLRLVIEAKREDLLEEKKKEILNFIKSDFKKS